MKHSKIHENQTRIIFILYLVLLVWVVLFKLNTNLLAIDHMRSVNLIPFHYEDGSNLFFHRKEVIANILVFIPLGVYTCIFRPQWSVLQRVVPALGLSILFESVQFLFAMGATDITDIITNTLGALLGILLFAILKRIWEKNCIAIINGIGLCIEIMALALILLLTLANGAAGSINM